MDQVLLKILQDSVDENGNPIVDNFAYDFSLFKDAPLPKPSGDRNVIVLYCSNVGDGVGDFAHLKRYYERIKALVGHDYEIKLVLNADMREISDKQPKALRDQNAFWNRNQERVIQQYHNLCKAQGLEPLIYETPEYHKRSKDAAKMTELVNRAAAVFNISNGYFPSEYVETRTDLFPVQCHEFSGMNNPTDFAKAFQNGSIGLGPSKEKSVAIYGIDLDADQPDQDGLAQRLSNFKSVHGQALIAELLNYEVNPEKALAVLKSHKLMPGYPQTTWAAQNFILLGILKNSNNGDLNANCDFFLPKEIIRVDELRLMLQKLNIQGKVEIITPEGTNVIQEQGDGSGKAVRIFSGFYVDDQEYKDLYRAQTDIALGSGDNTIAQVLSNQHLPYFHTNNHLIIGFVTDGLGGMIHEMAQDVSDAAIKDKLAKLDQYVSLVASFNLTFKLKETQYGSPVDTDKFNWDNINNRQAEYLQYMQDLSKLASDPDVTDAWAYVHNIIKEKYNYNEHFRNILAGALYLNNPQPSASSESDTLPPVLYDFVPVRFAHWHQARQRFSTKDIAILATDKIQFLLERGIFENEDEIVEFITHFSKVKSVFSYDSILKTIQWIRAYETKASVKLPAHKIQTIITLEQYGLISLSKLDPNNIRIGDFGVLPSVLDFIRTESPEEEEPLRDITLSTIRRYMSESLYYIWKWTLEADGKNSASILLDSIINDWYILHEMPDDLLMFMLGVISIKEMHNEIDNNYRESIVQVLEDELESRQATRRVYVNQESLMQNMFEFAIQNQNPTVAKEVLPHLPDDYKRSPQFLKLLQKNATYYSKPISQMIWHEIRTYQHNEIVFNILRSDSYLKAEVVKECVNYLKEFNLKVEPKALLDHLFDNPSEDNMRYMLQSAQVFKMLNPAEYRTFKEKLKTTLKQNALYNPEGKWDEIMELFKQLNPKIPVKRADLIFVSKKKDSIEQAQEHNKENTMNQSSAYNKENKVDPKPSPPKHK